MLNPSDDLVDWVLKTVPTMGAGWCPPGILGVGIGGTPEKSHAAGQGSHHGAGGHPGPESPRGQDQSRGTAPRTPRKRSMPSASARRASGGLTTVLDVKVLDYPTHAANLPVALIPNCAATRHCHFHLDGSGPAQANTAQPRRLAPRSPGRPIPPPPTRVDLNSLTKAQVAAWKPGQKTAAQRQDADRPRRRAQAHRRHAGQGRENCRSTSPTASSTTSVQSILSAARWSARPVPPPRHGWTNSPA
jgi:fumarate hydratase class I